jgi:hypothetical protein
MRRRTVLVSLASMRRRKVLVSLAASAASLLVCAGGLYLLVRVATHQAIEGLVMVSADGRTISTIQRGCHTRAELKAHESARTVRLSLTAIANVPGCNAFGFTSATLSHPLAKRDLLDTATDRPVGWLDGGGVLRPPALPPGYAPIRELTYHMCWVQQYGRSANDINALVIMQCAPSLAHPGRAGAPLRPEPSNSAAYYDPFELTPSWGPAVAIASTTVRGAPGQSLVYGDPEHMHAVKWWPGDDGYVVVVAEAGFGPVLPLDEVTEIAEALTRQ